MLVSAGGPSAEIFSIAFFFFFFHMLVLLSSIRNLVLVLYSFVELNKTKEPITTKWKSKRKELFEQKKSCGFLRQHKKKPQKQNKYSSPMRLHVFPSDCLSLQVKHWTHPSR